MSRPEGERWGRAFGRLISSWFYPGRLGEGGRGEGEFAVMYISRYTCMNIHRQQCMYIVLPWELRVLA